MALKWVISSLLCYIRLCCIPLMEGFHLPFLWRTYLRKPSHAPRPSIQECYTNWGSASVFSCHFSVLCYVLLLKGKQLWITLRTSKLRANKPAIGSFYVDKEDVKMLEFKAFYVQVTEEQISDRAWLFKKLNPFLQPELTDSIYAPSSAVYQVSGAYNSRLLNV